MAPRLTEDPVLMQPMIIAEPEQSPVRKPFWSTRTLVQIWIYQFILLGIKQLTWFGAIAVLAGNKYPPIYIIIAIIIWIGNAAALVSIPYESHKYAAGTLTPELFFKIEMVKLVWLTSLNLILDFSSTKMISNLLAHLGAFFFGELFFCGPFIYAVYYARRVKNAKRVINVVNGVPHYV